MTYQQLTNEDFKLKNFQEVKERFEVDGQYLKIDNNKDGRMNLANFSKPFLSKKINAAGYCRVFVMKLENGFGKILGEINFIES